MKLRVAEDIAKVRGDIKVFLYVADYMVLCFCCYEESGQKVRLSFSKGSEEGIVWQAFTIFMLSGKMVRAE